MSEVISVKGETPNSYGPLIVRFGHGSLADPSQIRETELKVSSFDSQKTNKKKFTLSVKTNRLTYSNEALSVKKIPSVETRKTYLAIRNRRTDKVRLVEANYLTLGPEIALPPTANPILIENNASNAPEISDKVRKEELKKHLVREFGQSKGRRFYEQADRMKVDVNKMVHKLQYAAENVDESALVIPEVQAQITIIPECNREAIVKNDVYRLNDMILEEELLVLQEAISNFSKVYPTDEEVDRAVEQKNVSKMFGVIYKRENQSSSSPSRNMAIGFYTEALIRFSRLSPTHFRRGLTKSLPAYFPESIKRKITETFSNNGDLTPETQDRTVCYIIILSLLASNYNFNLNNLSSSVHVKADKLKKLIGVTGASILTDPVSGQSEVVLKIPLSNFDANRAMRRRNKRK